VHNSELVSAYIFRDARVRYDKFVSNTSTNSSDNAESPKCSVPNTLECICTLVDKNFSNILVPGFYSALDKCRRETETEHILVENTSNSEVIVDYMKQQNIACFLQNPTAFFLYNYACHSILPTKCLLIY
jgi:hypothetical protein